MASQLGLHLARKPGATVGHGEQDPRDGELWIELRLDEVDRAEELRETFEGVVLGLDGNDRPVGRGERVDRERPEGRRTVQKHVRVRVECPDERVGEVSLSAVSARQLDGRGCEVALRHHDVEVLERSRLRELRQGDAVEKVVRGRAVRPHSQPGRRVRLWVEIDEKHALARLGEAGAQVDSSRRLSDAAFLVRNGVDPCGHVARLETSPARVAACVNRRRPTSAKARTLSGT